MYSVNVEFIPMHVHSIEHNFQILLLHFFTVPPVIGLLIKIHWPWKLIDFCRFFFCHEKSDINWIFFAWINKWFHRKTKRENNKRAMEQYRVNYFCYQFEFISSVITISYQGAVCCLNRQFRYFLSAFWKTLIPTHSQIIQTLFRTSHMDHLDLKHFTGKCVFFFQIYIHSLECSMGGQDLIAKLSFETNISFKIDCFHESQNYDNNNNSWN